MDSLRKNISLFSLETKCDHIYRRDFLFISNNIVLISFCNQSPSLAKIANTWIFYKEEQQSKQIYFLESFNDVYFEWYHFHPFN